MATNSRDGGLAINEPDAISDIILSPPFDNYFLSSLNSVDFARLVELYNNTDLSHILLSPPYPYTLEDAQWFNDNRAHNKFTEYPGTREVWVIRSKIDGDILVGMCATHPHPNLLKNHFRLGYFVAPEFRGKGIMPAVVNEVLERFTGAEFEAEAEISNLSSQKVLERSGFRKVKGPEHELEWPESKGGGVRKMEKFLRSC
ncbi:hypothetical protein ABW20_dc0108366 [Dactylellina cionopaga]|nr:hypothetical protein ABW20_dc0108366 [Dactylellina cionopaga]